MNAVMPLPNNFRSLDDGSMNQNRIVTHANRVLEESDRGHEEFYFADKRVEKIARNLYVAFKGYRPLWLEPITQRLNAILDPDGDPDGSASRSVSTRVAADVLRFLANSMEEDTPIPTLSSTIHGGIQTIWRTHDFDLEIEHHPDEYYAVYFDDERGEFDTLEITANENCAYQLVVELVDRITARAVSDAIRSVT